MSDIFREVDEELRQDQFKKLWKKYGWAAIAAVLLIVVGVGGKQAWDAYQRNKALEQSERYSAAMRDIETEDTAAALDKLGALAEDSGGHALLALFHEARLEAEGGNIEGAVQAYGEIVARAGAESGLGKLAVLHSVMLRADSGDPAALRGELQPLLAQSDPFRPAALELSGTLFIREGDIDSARADFTALSEADGATPAMRARATQILTALGE